MFGIFGKCEDILTKKTDKCAKFLSRFGEGFNGGIVVVIALVGTPFLFFGPFLLAGCVANSRLQAGVMLIFFFILIPFFIFLYVSAEKAEELARKKITEIIN